MKYSSSCRYVGRNSRRSRPPPPPSLLDELRREQTRGGDALLALVVCEHLDDESRGIELSRLLPTPPPPPPPQ